MNDTPSYRILDAAANRAGEGLRVVEDYLRFVLDDAYLTRLCKQLRHDLATACAALPRLQRSAARDTQLDVGTKITTDSETARTDAWEVCIASLERSKQSLRSLEEYSKTKDIPLTRRLEESLPNQSLPNTFEALRYQLYTLEKAISITQDSHSRLVDANLCVLLDSCPSSEEFSQLVKQLLAAEVGMIQLRDKHLPDDQLVERARLLVTLAQQHTTLTIINDRPDIAAAAHADGVHLGQDDLSVKDARAVLGPRQLIGVSTHSLEQARTAVLDGANYLGAGPTFPSSTKQFDAFPGLEFLKQVAAEITLPTFAIGGIQEQNLAQVLDAGITRVAVSGAISASTTPGESASKLLTALRQTSNTP